MMEVEFTVKSETLHVSHLAEFEAQKFLLGSVFKLDLPRVPAGSYRIIKAIPAGPDAWRCTARAENSEIFQLQGNDMTERKRWVSRTLEADEFGNVHFDVRIGSPLEVGGHLVVCDTFKEFAPLLMDARNLRDGAADLLAQIDYLTNKEGEDLGASLNQSAAGLRVILDRIQMGIDRRDRELAQEE